MVKDHLSVDNAEYAKIPECLSKILVGIDGLPEGENVFRNNILETLEWWTMRIKKLTFRRNQVVRYSSFDSVSK